VDLRQLRYFMAVAEERNFGRAAARLHISQPPITRQIHMLESELGVLLFERTRWGVNLTPAGEELLASASQIEALVDYASDRARRAGLGAIGRLDVGVFGSGAISIVPTILRRYLKANPAVEVIVHNVPQPAQLVALRQRRILITFDRYLPDDADLTVETVVHEGLLLAVKETNVLAKRRIISVGALSEEPMVMARDVRHREWVRDLCRAHGFEPKVSQLAGDMISGVVMASNGFGVQVVPESAQALKLPGLVYRPLKSNARAYNAMELQCAYLRNEASPLQRLLDVVRDYRNSRSPKTYRGVSTTSAVKRLSRRAVNAIR
jgi:LysR family transcriptional regulator, benzoate and cis,cis-muconate-responsive activator of ben and cat genes